MTTFKPTYLYIKQHSKTGKLYFGKTISYNPESYKGSGIKWKNHIAYHGREHVITLWYCLFYNQEDCTKFALMFSELNDIVKSDEWLNLQPETGIDSGSFGYKHSEETKRKISEKNKISIKKYFESDEGKARALSISEKRIGKKSSYETRKKQSDGLRIAYKEGIRIPKSEKELERLRTMNIGRKCSKERIEQLRNNFKGKHHTEEAKQKLREAAKGRIMPTTKGIIFETKTCPHCKLEGRGGAMKRYHFDNCKSFNK